MDGLIYIDKEKDMTSRDVVNISTRICGTKKVGHTGTLDPMATGLLILCVGRATKLVEILTDHDKEYICEVTLGVKTDTSDITGTIIEKKESHYTKEEIGQVLKEMVGTYEQEVPIYSAVKINGKKLYEYAREEKPVILPKRNVTIRSLELLTEPVYEDGTTVFQIKTNVSKGTYIRSLVVDIATKLNTIGTMSALRRTRVGSVRIADANTLDELKQRHYQIHSIYEILSRMYPTYILPNKLEKKVLNGAKIENPEGLDMILFVNDKKEPIALYQKEKEYLVCYKMFAI